MLEQNVEPESLGFVELSECKLKIKMKIKICKVCKINSSRYGKLRRIGAGQRNVNNGESAVQMYLVIHEVRNITQVLHT